MSNKRVYFTVLGTSGPSSGSVIGLLDTFTSGSIPLVDGNRDYQQYLLLSASDRAIAVEDEGSIPSGTINSPEVYSDFSVPVTSSF